MGQAPVGQRGGWAADLCLGVDIRDGVGGITARLTSALRDAIRQGRLGDGSRLPPSRQLADELECSRSVIVGAYEQLAVEGYLVSRQGSGTYVSARPAHEPVRRQVAAELLQYSFLAGVADLGSFPRHEWERAVGHVMATATRADFHYSTPSGNLTFRRTIAERLARVRGVTTVADHVHACAGTVQAVSLLAHALRRTGVECVAIEDPGWSRLRPPLEQAGLRVLPVPVDGEGIDLRRLRSEPGIGAVMITPAHQFPTGAVMSAARRRALVDWSRENGVVLVEDDYDAEYHHERHAVTALQSAAPEQVVYLGTTSKTLSPALRLGWMVTPARLTAVLDELRPAFDLGVSVIDQLVLAHLIANGSLDRHLREMRALCQRRRRQLVDELSRRIPEAVVSGAPDGLHVRVEFPADCREEDLVAEAARRSVKVLSYRSYFAGVPRADLPPTLVMGYASMTHGQIATGVGLLAEAWRAARSRRSKDS